MAVIIVTYDPDIILFEYLITALSPQIPNLIVVDNASHTELQEKIKKIITGYGYWCPLDENRGVAAAQNVGIQWARKHGAGFVLLMDQDSRPAPDMVDQLLKAVNKLEDMGVEVASVGPRYTDERQQNPPPFIQVKGLSLHRRTCDEPDSLVEVDYLISSGCLISISTLDQVGGMDDKMFIDYVDIEWGLRAKAKGFQSFGVCAALMQHDLGDNPIHFFGRKIPLHSPLRHYYHFRNAIYLYKQYWAPFNWKLVDGWRLFLKYGFYSLLARPRLTHFRMMTLGIWHGLRGKMGKFAGA